MTGTQALTHFMGLSPLLFWLWLVVFGFLLLVLLYGQIYRLLPQMLMLKLSYPTFVRGLLFVDLLILASRLTILNASYSAKQMIIQVMEKNAKWWWWCCCWDWFWGMKERKRRREIWIEKGGGAQGVSYSWSWTIARINGQNGLNRTHMPNNSPCVHVNLHLSSTALEILYLFLSLSIWSWESNYDM